MLKVVVEAVEGKAAEVEGARHGVEAESAAAAAVGVVPCGSSAHTSVCVPSSVSHSFSAESSEEWPDLPTIPIG